MDASCCSEQVRRHLGLLSATVARPKRNRGLQDAAAGQHDLDITTALRDSCRPVDCSRFGNTCRIICFRNGKSLDPINADNSSAPVCSVPRATSRPRSSDAPPRHKGISCAPHSTLMADPNQLSTIISRITQRKVRACRTQR